MSKLGKLIRELCPDGVRFERIGECCRVEKGNTPIQKAIPGEYPLVVTASERKTCNSYQFEEPTVCVPLISSRGHGVASLNEIYYQEGKFALGNILCGVTPLRLDLLSARFVTYYLNHMKDVLIVPLMRGGANVSLSVDSIKRVRIPVPPIEVQQEIVRILDSFTELTAELQAELQARKKQYEYYQDLLLEFENEAEELTLGDILKFQNGFAFKSKLFKDSGKPILRITNIQDNQIKTDSLAYFSEADYNIDLQQYAVQKGDIVVAMSGATTGKIGVNNTDTVFYLNQRVGKFIPKKKIVLNRYLYHLLLKYSPKILEISSGTGAQPNLSSEKLKKLTVRLPSIEVQQKVVDFLDRFDTLCNDLSTGLPAEIEARQKQYEYYRDKLLTFKEKA